MQEAARSGAPFVEAATPGSSPEAAAATPPEVGSCLRKAADQGQPFVELV